jgi:glycosyltransferase involved in cell wall biosynthesis
MISIVIPALNEEKYLSDCLNSIKNQDWDGDYEIIVVDNGSADNTATIAARHGATVIACPKRGVVYARQAGAEQARGDIVVQVDADTIYPPGWLTRIARHFAAYPDSAALAGRYVYLKPVRWTPIERAFRKYLNKAGRLVFRWPPSVSGANFAFRRTAFVQAQGYDPASLYPDQWGIARRLSRFGRVRYDDKSVVATSPRRVAKPFYIIAFEIIRNCSHIGLHFLRHCAGEMKTLARKREMP